MAESSDTEAEDLAAERDHDGESWAELEAVELDRRLDDTRGVCAAGKADRYVRHDDYDHMFLDVEMTIGIRSPGSHAKRKRHSEDGQHVCERNAHWVG